MFATQIGAASTQGQCIINAGYQKEHKSVEQSLYRLNALEMVICCKLGSTQMAQTITNGIHHITIVATLRREGMYGRPFDIL
eukprot:15002928-Ditylum_brightwellii.AAC.1